MAFVIFDLGFYFRKITPFSPPEFVYPETPVIDFLKDQEGIDRFWGYGSAYIDTNFSTYNHTFSPEGNDPLLIRRYGELISASDNGQVSPAVARADVILAGGFGTEALRQNPYRQRLLDILGVKYLLHKNDGLGGEWQPDEQTFPPEIYQLVWQENNWQVYENLQSLPRPVLIGDYQVESDPQKIIATLFDPDFEWDQKVILEESLPASFKLDTEATGEIIDLDYRPNLVSLKVKVSGNALLFLSDNYFPGWQAQLDGRPVKIYRADYSFRAVAVPAGEHQLIFKYQPALFTKGLVLSTIGLAIMVFFAFFVKKSKWLKS
jgi:hypothetical protein